MKTEKIIKVLNVKCHCYDGSQCETAIYAKSDSRPGYRWYVGYGGDMMPATKADLDNMRDYINQSDEMQGLNRFVGNVVYKYRNN